MKKGLALLMAVGMLTGIFGCMSEGQSISRKTEETDIGSLAGQDGADEPEMGETVSEGSEKEAESKTREEKESGTESETDGSVDAVEEEETEESGEFSADRPKVRGIYVTGPMAGTANMDNLIDLVDRTELNAMVIDIKNDEGYLTCDMGVALAEETGSVKSYVRDMPELVRKCKEKDIYLIARIVAFKDPYLAEKKPEWSLHNTDGTIFRDKDKLAWLNPYEVQVWDYLVQIGEGAADLGFDEVQFDYIRFSTDKGMKQVDFGPDAQEKGKTEVITEFAAYAAERLRKKGVAVSADVYGVVIDSATDQQIVGQDYMALAEHLDYLSPMVYPSHYGPYNYNIPVPDAQPYDTVLAAMQASKKVLAGVMSVGEPEEEPKEAAENVLTGNDGQEGSESGDFENGLTGDGGGTEENPEAETSESGADETRQDAGTEPSAEEIAALLPLKTVRADVRPWLQDFTATWVKGHIPYGPQQIRDQIRAVYDAGYEEWILWNAANRYTEGGLYGVCDSSDDRGGK